MRVRIAALLCWSACVPANDEIGRTEWVAPGHDSGGVVGPGGHVLLAGGGLPVELIGPDGEEVWTSPCDDFCFGGVVDVDGNAYQSSSGPGVVLRKFAAADGSVEWSHTFDSPSASDVALGSDGTVWLLLAGGTPIDLGGGLVGGDDLGGRWARYAADGTHIASGAFDFFLHPFGARALPGGGLVVRGSSSTVLVAIDDSGAELWRLERQIFDFVIHEDGELTIAQRVEGADETAGESRVELVRLDADRRERWRHAVPGDVQLTPIAGGSVLAYGGDGLAYSGDVWYLELVNPDGESRREVFEDFVVLLVGPPLDGFRFENLAQGSLTARSLR